MTKLPNIFKTNSVVISQGGHPQVWNGQNLGNIAIDFSYIDNLICPFDNCEIVTYSSSFPANVRQSYFGLKLPNGDLIVVVHAKPTKTGKVNKGEPFAFCTWHHYHLFMIVGGKGENILSYLDRSIKLSTQASLYGGNSNHPDGQWATYPDKYLNIINPNQLTMEEKNQLNDYISKHQSAIAMPEFNQLQEDERHAIAGGGAPNIGYLVARINGLREQIKSTPVVDTTEETPRVEDINVPKSNGDKMTPVAQPLPIYKRAVLDTLRDGSYALGGVLVATGAVELATEFIATGDLSQEAFTRLGLGLVSALLGYYQAIQKEERKKLEK
jgi:hypothetical protein